MSLSLFWQRQFKNLRQPNTPYYRQQRLTGAEIIAIAAAHRRRDARARRWADRRQRVAQWFAARLPSFLATVGISSIAAALAVFMGMQPVVDELAQDNAQLSQRLNEWRDVATRQATNEITLNLRGNANEVRRSVKRIAEDIDK